MKLTLAFNSFAVAAGATLLAVAAGLAVALCIASARRAGRSALITLAVLSLAVPPFLSANAWLDLTGKWRALWPPELVAHWSLPLTALVLASLLWPLTALVLVSSWTKLQPGQLEVDPQVRGLWLLRRLLLPVARAELGVVAAVTLVLALANFTVPTLFQVRVFTEEFWIRFNTQFDTAGALRATWPLVLVPLLLLVALRRREVRWPRLQASPVAELLRRQLGWVRGVAASVAAAWLLVALGIPLIKLLTASRTWSELPAALNAGGNALLNSAGAASLTATSLTAFAVLVGTGGIRGRLPSLAWIVFLLPGVFLGVALIWVFNRAGLSWFYQSPLIVLVALALRYLAPGWATVAHAVRSVDTDLVDAARNLGAPPRRAFLDAVWPQARAQVAVAWYLVYLLCLWDVETVVLIQPPGGETLALRIFNLLHYGHAGQVNALCVVMLGLAVAPLLLWLAWNAASRGGSSKLNAQGSREVPRSERNCSRSMNRRRMNWKTRTLIRPPGTFSLPPLPLRKGEGDSSWVALTPSGGAFTRAAIRARLREPGAWTFAGALSLLLGAFVAGCSPRPTAGSVALDSKLFASVQIIGTRGVAPGQFNKPRSLTCDRDDNLYVTDMTGRVQKFSADGRFILQWQMPQTDLGKPKGMCLDNDGNVVVVEPHYQRINHFTPDGQLVAQWGVKGTNVGEFILPRSIAQNSRGEFFISEYTLVDRVQRFAVGRASGLPASPIHIPVRTADADRELEARVTGVWGTPGLGPGEFNRAEGVGLDRSNRVYVADSCNHRIQVFDADGKLLRAHGKAGSIPGDFSYPYDIKVDSDGNQFVCEFGNSRITVLDTQDRVIEVLGRAGGGAGEFANPWSLALDSKGNLYVADSQNHRVQRFNRKRPLTGNPVVSSPVLAGVPSSEFRVPRY